MLPSRSHVLAAAACTVVTSQTLRIPPSSILQKQHNVGVAMEGFESMGLRLGSDKAAVAGVKGASGVSTIAPKDVANGHKEKTLALLWAVMFQWQVPSLVNVQRLQRETTLIQKSHAKCAALLAEARASGLVTPTAAATATDVTFGALQHLLLQWCQAVCGVYGHVVKDLSESLADGKALCYIIHHYQPTMLPRDRIERSAAERMAAVAAAPQPAHLADAVRKKARAAGVKAERANFRMVRQQAAALGCIPFMGACTWGVAVGLLLAVCS